MGKVVFWLVGGILAGFGCRPRYARLPPAFLPADEVAPAILCTLAGAALALGGCSLIVRRKGW